MKIKIEVPEGITCRGCKYLMPAKNRTRNGKDTRWCDIFQTPIQVNEANTEFTKATKCFEAGEI